MTTQIAAAARGRLIRACFFAYLILCAAMIATSAYTGHRATQISGQEHYLLTTTRIFVPEELDASNETDAAFDEAFREAGESPAMTVEKPIFVLGFLDATAPVVVIGGALLGTASWVSRRRAGRRASSFAGADQAH